MKTVFAAILLLGVGIVVWWSVTFSVPTEDLLFDSPPQGTYALEVVPSVEKRKIHLGESMEVSFSLRNAGSSEILVLPFLDGSEEGIRYPHCRIEIRDQSGKLQDVASPRKCGNLNRISEANFKLLRAGDSVDLPHSGLRHWRPVAVGVYSISCTYDSSSSRAGEWRPMGSGTRDSSSNMPRSLVKLFNSVPKQEIRSKIVEVIVEPP